MLQNIIKLSKPIQLCKTFRDIIITNCSFTVSELDKIDFKGDDSLQRKRLMSTVDTDEHVYKIFKQIFDDISLEDTIKILTYSVGL